MAWEYSALQEKLSAIQSKLSATMDHRSDHCQDQLMTQMSSTNDSQENHGLKQGMSLKRKAGDYFPVGVDNVKTPRPCLMMLDMYTQTDKSMSNDISLGQVYDLVKQNCERLRKIEDILMKLNTTFEGVSDYVLGERMTSQSTTPPLSTPPSSTKPSSAIAVFTRSQSPPSCSRPTFIGSNCYPGISTSSTAFPASVESYGAQEMEDWTQERHDITSVSTSPPPCESRLHDGSSAEEKISTKEEWDSDCADTKPTIVMTQEVDQPSGPGCWLGDANDVTDRAWFSGDPKVIERCENYGANPVKLALSLTEALFTREEMAASNVRGTRGKESLDPNKIKAIRGHVDYKYPINDDRMELRWQLIKPKIDSKCRSQRRLQREHKWRSERTRVSVKPATPAGQTRQKRPVLNIEERETLLYGSPLVKTSALNSPVVSVYTENQAGVDGASSFSEEHEGYLGSHGE